MISHPTEAGGAADLQSLLESGTSSFVVIDTYVIGTYMVTSDSTVIRRGVLSSRLGLDPQTLDITISIGGAGATLTSLKADTLSGALDGQAFTYSRTYIAGSDSGVTGTALRFTGTVQRAEATSAEVRIVAITELTKLGSVQLPSHVILPAEFPEIPPPANYNVR